MYGSFITTLTTDLLHVQCKEILLVLITVGPSVQTWIFISVFHYTCIRFRELIWNLYCSLIIKKKLPNMSFDNNEQTKAEINFKRLLFFSVPSFTFWKFFDQILLILFSIRNWGCRKRGMYCLCNILRILVTWAYRETSINVLVTLSILVCQKPLKER